MAAAPRTICIDGVDLRLCLTRKAVKNINARLVDGELRVSAPYSASAVELDEKIAVLGRRLLRRERAREVNGKHDALALARRVARRFPHPPGIADADFSTNQKTRWGSYSTRTKSIKLNAALRLMPPWVLEAIVAHELAHVVHPDHSTAFWKLLRSVCPNTDRARAFLEGVSWFGQRLEDLPAVERALLSDGGRQVD